MKKIGTFLGGFKIIRQVVEYIPPSEDDHTSGGWEKYHYGVLRGREVVVPIMFNMISREGRQMICHHGKRKVIFKILYDNSVIQLGDDIAVQ